MQCRHQKGFTLIELLIVISIILILLSMGMFALGGLNTPPLEESANTIRSAMSIARQYSVTHGVPVYVVFEDNGESRFDSSAPIPDTWDKVTVLPMRLKKDLKPEAGKTLLTSPPTATYAYALDMVNEPLMSREMHKPVEFDYITGAQPVLCLLDENDLPTSEVTQILRYIRFNPNGTCDSSAAALTEPVIPSDRPGIGVAASGSIRLSNFIGLYDTVEDKRLYLYVYPSTCYVHIRGD